MAEINKRSTLIPAVIFAITAVCIGMIISAIIDYITTDTLSNIIRDIVVRIGAGYRYANEEMIGIEYDLSEIEGIKYGLGTAAIWLMSCLGGITASFSGIAGSTEQSVSGAVTASLGITIMLVIPIISMLTARIIRNVIIRKVYPDKEFTPTDAILSASLFTLINLIIAILPNPLIKALTLSFEEMDDFANLSVKIGVNIFPLLVFSFITAYIFSTSRQKRSTIITESCRTALCYGKLMIIAGFTAVVSLLIIEIIYMSTSGFFNGEIWGNMIEEGVVKTDVIGIIALIPNLTIWAISFFIGGALTLASSSLSFTTRFFSLNNLYGRIFGSEYGEEIALYNPIIKVEDIKVGTFGANFESPYFTVDASWVGILFLIAGFLIALAAVHKTLRDSDSFSKSAIVTILFSTVMIWFVSLCAEIAIRINFDAGYGDEGFFAKLSSASLINAILCAVIMICAILTVHTAKKVPVIDKVITKITSIPVILIITVISTVVACLTIKSEIIMW